MSIFDTKYNRKTLHKMLHILGDIYGAETGVKVDNKTGEKTPIFIIEARSMVALIQDVLKTGHAHGVNAVINSHEREENEDNEEDDQFSVEFSTQEASGIGDVLEQIFKKIDENMKNKQSQNDEGADEKKSTH